MSGYRDEVKPTSNTGKIIVLLLGLTVLAVLIGARFFSSAGFGQLVEEGTETLLPTEPVATIAPTQELVEVVPTPTIDNSLAPTITSATISPTENGDQLNLSGLADIACGELVGFLDGIEIGRTAPTASGTWALSVSAPAVGDYNAVMQCVTDENVFAAAPVKIQVPAQPTDVTAEISGTETITTTPAITTTVETPITDEVALLPPTVDQPEFNFANNMEDWIGGPLLVRGSAEAGSEIELIFVNDAIDPIVATTTVNGEGRFAERVFLTEFGEYDVTVQYAGSQAQPSASVVVPSDINFGQEGNCVGTVPPFGTIEGDVYIVNTCEYFSLIANRLGVSYRDLLAVNRNILNPNNLRAGDPIQIPPLP